MKKILILLALAAAALDAGELRAGAAAVRITPPVGIPLAGYYSVRLAEGTHDELYAKALVFEQDGQKAALVACDLVGIDRELVEQARKQIQSLTGIGPQRVMISATHSHTGPLLNPRFLEAIQGTAGKIAAEYRQALPGRIAESVRLANAALEPARLLDGVGHESSLSFNRRYFMADGSVGWNPGKLNPKIVRPAGPIDPDVPVVYLERADGKPLATYVNFAMHLDTVGGTRFSADYAYTLAKLLGAVKGAGMLTLFTIGTAGNINHIDVKSKEPQKGDAEAERIGTILAGEVVKTYARLRPIATAAPRVASKTVALDSPPYTAEELERARAIAANFGKRPAPPFLEQVKAFRILDIAGRNGKPLMAEVQVIALGSELAWVGLPGEIFVELGAAIKKASPFSHTVIAELANGAIGYVPDRTAYPQGNYEVVSTRAAAGSGEALAETAIHLLRSMKSVN